MNSQDKGNNYDYIRFAVADMVGRSCGRVVPVRHAQRFLATGVSTCGVTLMFNCKGEDVVIGQDDPTNDRLDQALLKPDVDTIYTVPWCGGESAKVVEVICESYWLEDLTPQKACPRHVARIQLQRLSDLGFELLSAFEMEFSLKNERWEPTQELKCMSIREVSRHGEMLFKIIDHLNTAGVDIEAIHCENKSCDFEVAMKPLKGIATADSAFKFQNGVPEIADKLNYKVSFKSENKNADYGMHFNHSLWLQTRDINVFRNSRELSDIGKHWLAGILRHARALTAFYSPTAHCYHRLNKPHRPGSIFWGRQERSACVRVKQSCPTRGIYLENRMPSAMSNPYLVLAATVAAGLDGVVNKLHCPPLGEDASNESLPNSVSESIKALLSDTDLVKLLGNEFVDWYVLFLRSNEDA